jgi:hypothetical protein
MEPDEGEESPDMSGMSVCVCVRARVRVRELVIRDTWTNTVIHCTNTVRVGQHETTGLFKPPAHILKSIKLGLDRANSREVLGSRGAGHASEAPESDAQPDLPAGDAGPVGKQVCVCVCVLVRERERARVGVNVHVVGVHA